MNTKCSIDSIQLYKVALVEITCYVSNYFIHPRSSFNGLLSSGYRWPWHGFVIISRRLDVYAAAFGRKGIVGNSSIAMLFMFTYSAGQWPLVSFGVGCWACTSNSPVRPLDCGGQASWLVCWFFTHFTVGRYCVAGMFSTLLFGIFLLVVSPSFLQFFNGLFLFE